jgi:hypothetical protein
MAFMQQQVTNKRSWWEVDGTNGTEWFDQEDFTEKEARDNYQGKVWSSKPREGFGARLSAPGYLDCTEWSVFDTEKEAWDYLEESYGDDESIDS